LAQVPRESAEVSRMWTPGRWMGKDGSAGSIWVLVGGGMAEARHDAARDVRASLRNVAECMVAVSERRTVDWCGDVVTVS
jgi:hypothetical protein